MCVHRIPLPTSVTIAKRPSCECGTGERKPLIWGRRKAEYFYERDWTTQIGLNHLTKSRFTRTPFSVVRVVPTAQHPRKSTRSARLAERGRFVTADTQRSTGARCALIN